MENRSEIFRHYGLACLVYAFFTAFCLYRNTDGITYPFFMAATLVLLIRFMKKAGYALDNKGIFYAVCLSLLALSKCTTASVPLQLLDTLFIIIMLISLVGHCCHMLLHGFTANTAKYVCLLFMPLCYADRPFRDAAAFAAGLSNKKDSPKNRTAGQILAGVGIALPLLIVVTWLLSSADVVFGKAVSEIFKNIRLPRNVWDFAGICFMIFAAFILSYGIYYLINEKRQEPEKAEPVRHGTAVALTFMGLLTALYLVFSIIQVIYLFLGNMQLPDGYTYAEYVHEGFYQLVFVCIINLAAVMIVSEHFCMTKALKVLLCVFSGCTYIMMASSVLRMAMYVYSYGLTFLRLFVLWFIAVIFVWFTALIISLFSERFDAFGFFIMSAAVMYLLFALAHPDFWIARFDIAAGKGDTYYLAHELSYDAAPALTGDAKLETMLQERITEDKTDNKDFRHWNLSEQTAKTVIKKQR